MNVMVPIVLTGPATSMGPCSVIEVSDDMPLDLRKMGAVVMAAAGGSSGVRNCPYEPVVAVVAEVAVVVVIASCGCGVWEL